MPLSCRAAALALCLIAAGLPSGLASPALAQPAGPSAEASGSTAPEMSADRRAVRQAALDYVEALYRVDTTRIVRSVHPDLVKHGYYRQDGSYRGSPMTYEELKGLASRWNEGRRRVDPDTARKDVAVFEVLDKTASARVTAHWGRDYMHLVKTDGRWQIQQILWQSHPPRQ